MNFPVFFETGPDSGSTAITLTSVDMDGNARAIETRGVLAHKAPLDSLGASRVERLVSDSRALCRRAGEPDRGSGPIRRGVRIHRAVLRAGDRGDLRGERERHDPGTS